MNTVQRFTVGFDLCEAMKLNDSDKTHAAHISSEKLIVRSVFNQIEYECGKNRA